MFFFLFYSALFSLSPFIFSLPFTCLYHSPFSLTYCRLLVLWLLFITFLLFSLAPFLHIFSSRAFLDISPVGVAYLWPFGTYASFCVCCCVWLSWPPPKAVFQHDMRCPCFRCYFPPFAAFLLICLCLFPFFYIIVALARFIPSLPNLPFLPSGGLSYLSHMFRTSLWSFPSYLAPLPLSSLLHVFLFSRSFFFHLLVISCPFL